MSPPADVEAKVTETATALNDVTSKTIGRALWVRKFDVTNERYQHLRLKVNQKNEPGTVLRNKSNSLVYFLVKSFRAYGLDQVRGTLFISTAATTKHSGTCESALSSTSRIFTEAASVVLLDNLHWLEECVTFRRLKILLGLKCFCWRGASRNKKAAQLQTWKHSSLVTLQVRSLPTCVAILLLLRKQIL